jgi:hypothetical protein
MKKDPVNEINDYDICVPLPDYKTVKVKVKSVNKYIPKIII